MAFDILNQPPKFYKIFVIANILVVDAGLDNGHISGQAVGIKELSPPSL